MLSFRGYQTVIKHNKISDVELGIAATSLEGAISQNFVYNANQHGIFVDFGDLAHVTNNTIYMTAGSTGNCMTLYRMNSSNIMGNTVDGGKRGMYIQQLVSCVIMGNTISNASTVGVYSWTGCLYNYMGLNSFRSVPTYYDLALSPTNYVFGDDTAYAASWNGDFGTPTKNAVYDIIKLTIDDLDGFPDELKSLATVEIQQLENIDATTISAAQWGYLGAMSEQPLENIVEDGSPQLGANLDCQAFDITNVGNVDGKDVSSLISSLVEDLSPQLGGDLDLNSHNIDFPSVANVSDCKDEDDMASNSATMLATQQSIKAYADARVDDTVYGAGWNGVTSKSPSENVVYDKINTMDTNIASNTSYQTTQHTRELIPSKVLPEQGDVAGTNNVWEASGVIQHGHNSYASSNFVQAYFKLPSDYVSGENFTFTVWWWSPHATTQIDWQWIADLYSDGSSSIGEDSGSGIQLSGVQNEYNYEEFTVTGTNFSAGDMVSIRWYQEDRNSASTTRSNGYTLKIPVNGRA